MTRSKTARKGPLPKTLANRTRKMRISSRELVVQAARSRLKKSRGNIAGLKSGGLGIHASAWLEGIMDNSPAMIFLKDLHGRYLHFNQRFARDFGLSLDQTVGKTDFDIFPPGQAAMFWANDQAVIKAGAPIVFDEVAGHGDGLHAGIVTKFPLFDKNGKVHAVGGIVTDITERKRLEEEILRVSEREQRRIAQDLHDGLGQQLTGIWFLSEVLRKNLKSGSSRNAAAAARLSKLLKSAVSHTRSLAKGLHPVAPEPRGLMSALHDLAGRITGLFKVRCRFKCAPPVPITHNSTANHLYRIAQEAATNSIKHGRAQNIEIVLSATPELIMLAISDDGFGFTKVKDHPGVGMQIMTHRAGLIGGTLLVQRQAGGGIKIMCVLEKPPAESLRKSNDKTNAKTKKAR